MQLSHDFTGMKVAVEKDAVLDFDSQLSQQEDFTVALYKISIQINRPPF